MGLFRREVYGVPVYDCVREITAPQRVDGSIVTVSPKFTRDASRVGWLRAVTGPELPQLRTCGIGASGSSDHGFAAGRKIEWMAIAVGSG